ncbi:MAG: ATP-binding cassette domain-containing protein [Chitinophagales bacterium]|nr:ATP-binding cassette domain-containing protein [Chitinophagales bacterium]MDW8393271.1 ATP-binding cassette domain-containing protein [Chitinophagales bacterium]
MDSGVLLSLQNVGKSFDKVRALDGVSFAVPRQSIYGILGPNGAGKTTALRIITTILKPDQGQVYFNGEPLQDRHASLMGYMPEERGLYKKMMVGEQLIYLARLKGLNAQQAKKQLSFWLEKFDIKNWYNKKVEDLSKGMAQKVQFIATILHQPQLIILDEPFSGLDPINTRLIEEEIRSLSQQGATILFSTHRMEQVEEFCEHILLINKGRVILSGKVSEIRQRFKRNEYSFHYEGQRPDLPEKVNIVRDENHELVVKLPPQLSGNDLLRELIARNVHITAFAELLPSLNEIFISQVAASAHE